MSKRPYPQNTKRRYFGRKPYPKADKSARWKGGQFTDKDGYIYLHKPDHPNKTSNNYIRRCRFVMSEHVGRPLRSDEIVHHINGIHDDDRIQNLVITERANHASKHHKGLIKPNSLQNLTREFGFKPGHPGGHPRWKH